MVFAPNARRLRKRLRAHLPVPLCSEYFQSAQSSSSATDNDDDEEEASDKGLVQRKRVDCVTHGLVGGLPARAILKQLATMHKTM